MMSHRSLEEEWLDETFSCISSGSFNQVLTHGDLSFAPNGGGLSCESVGALSSQPSMNFSNLNMDSLTSVYPQKNLAMDSPWVQPQQQSFFQQQPMQYNYPQKPQISADFIYGFTQGLQQAIPTLDQYQLQTSPQSQHCQPQQQQQQPQKPFYQQSSFNQFMTKQQLNFQSQNAFPQPSVNGLQKPFNEFAKQPNGETYNSMNMGFNKSLYQLPTTLSVSNVHSTPTNYHNMTTPSFVYRNMPTEQQQQQLPARNPIPEIQEFDEHDHAGKVVRNKKDKDLKNPYRRTRPKVVESKGAVACSGMNMKKGIRCRNAALMEFIGPRPIYCAEHIELDPDSIYIKCKSSYGKFPGDGKGCKEVILKEFVMCYKHFEDRLRDLPEEEKLPVATSALERVSELLTRLEKEAAAAKKKRHDLFQRKNKLIPKFSKMKSIITQFIEQRKGNTSDLNTTTTTTTIDVPTKSTNDEVTAVESIQAAPTRETSIGAPMSQGLDSRFFQNVPTQIMNICLDEEWKSLFDENLVTSSM